MKESGPINDANTVRKQIKDRLPQTSLRLKLSPQIAACFFGVPANIFKQRFSALIQTDQKEVAFLVADSRKVALNALQGWQNDQNEKSTTQFNLAMYQSLYRLVQAVRVGAGKKEVKGVSGLFLQLWEQEDILLKGTAQIIAEKGVLDESDLVIFQQKLLSLWDALPHHVQQQYGNINPQIIF